MIAALQSSWENEELQEDPSNEYQWRADEKIRWSKDRYGSLCKEAAEKRHLAFFWNFNVYQQFYFNMLLEKDIQTGLF